MQFTKVLSDGGIFLAAALMLSDDRAAAHKIE
jgi:hypothetical protein